ncbi:fam221a [Scenedesmus sp. PABB004]|nr:fam221a [Scenedesmus sp. PABB004]
MAAAGLGVAAAVATTQQAWEWRCGDCTRACVPIRTESRCLCGHRLREHGRGGLEPCARGGCACERFKFIVAEGAWTLRCSCKHRATEHHPTGAHACAKPRCECRRFHSPWVCNCDHPWARHEQVLVERAVLRLGDMLAQAQAGGGGAGAGAGGDDGGGSGGGTAAAAAAGVAGLSVRDGAEAAASGARGSPGRVQGSLARLQLRRAAAAEGGGGAELLLLGAGDLECEVNRHDLVLRGKTGGA